MILKMITFNMCHGKGLDGIVDIKRQAKFLKQYHPDIIFLQEVDMYTDRSGSINELSLFSKEANLPYSAMESNISLENGFYGDGILSRFPISFSMNYLMPKISENTEQRGIIRNKISFGTTKLNLFSVHFSTNKEERLLSSHALLNLIDKIDDDSVIFMAGDFNVGVTRLGKGNYSYQSEEKFEEYEILKEALHKLPNEEDTWFSQNGNACIDTIFHSPSAKLLRFETIPTDTSDHSALYAEFNI